MKQRGTVVVVDDNQDSLTIFGSIFTNAGYLVHTGQDGPQALELVRRLSPAALVLDIHLPRMDGIDVIRALRADPATARTPILALTADALPDTRLAVEAAGCDVFLRKPLDPSSLVFALTGLIEGGPFAVDPHTPGPPPPSPSAS
jgi:two-component system, cell cycle response regulator DivK